MATEAQWIDEMFTFDGTPKEKELTNQELHREEFRGG